MLAALCNHQQHFVCCRAIHTLVCLHALLCTHSSTGHLSDWGLLWGQAGNSIHAHTHMLWLPLAGRDHGPFAPPPHVHAGMLPLSRCTSPSGGMTTPGA